MKTKIIFLFYFIFITISHITLNANNSKEGILIWFYSLETKNNKNHGYIYQFTQSAGINYLSNKINRIKPLNPQSKVTKYKDNNWYLDIESDKIKVIKEEPLFLGQVVDIEMSDTLYEFLPKKYNIPIKKMQSNSKLSQYLLDRHDLQINDKEIIKIRNKLLKKNEKILDYIKAVDNFVHKQLNYKKPKRPNTAASLLNVKNGWCGEYTKLKLSLLRSAGIPSREVYASKVGVEGPSPDNVGSSKVHAWLQAHIPNIGWISIPSTRKMNKHNQFVKLRGGYYLRAFELYQHKQDIQKKHYSYNALKRVGGIRGNGMFFNVNKQYFNQIKLITNKILNYQSSLNDTIFIEVKKLPKQTQPLLYWFLISKPQSKIYLKASKLFIESLKENPTLNLQKFYIVSPTIVKLRIDNILQNY